jgi:prephenate dehydrogenase
MTAELHYDKVTIVGVGLMGGSLGLALKARGLAREVVGWGRNQGRLDLAVKLGAIDRSTRERGDALAGCQLLVFATPGRATEQLAAEWLPETPPGCRITDLVSVKGQMVETLTELTPARSSYISSHPLCGSEQDGVSAARPDLYQGQLCLITPVAGTRKTAIGEIQKLWQLLGMSVVSMAPAHHDRVVAAVSHLPHLVVTALINQIGDEKLLKFGGTGLRDTTRIASASPALWAEIITANRHQIVSQIEGMMENLMLAKQHVKSGDPARISQWLRKAALRRNKLEK